MVLYIYGVLFFDRGVEKQHSKGKNSWHTARVPQAKYAQREKRQQTNRATDQKRARAIAVNDRMLTRRQPYATKGEVGAIQRGRLPIDSHVPIVAICI